MIELFAIILHVFFLIILCSFPKKIVGTSNQNIINFPVSIIYLSTLILFFSFVNISINYVKYILILIFFNNLFFLIKNNNLRSYFNYKFLFFFITLLALSLDIAVNLKLGWDAQNYWIIKSLNFFYGGSIVDLQNLPRPDYPHFGSYLWAVFRSVSLLDHEYFGRIFYLFIFLSSIYSVSNYIKTSEFRKLLVFILLVVILNNNYLFNGYQEVLVFSYASIIGCLLLENYKKVYKLKNIVNLLMCFFIIFWLKNEAVIFSLILFFSIIIYNLDLRNKSILYLLFFLSLIVLRILIVKIFGLETNFQSGNYESFALKNLGNYISLDRILVIMKYTIISIIKVPITLILFIGLILNYFYNPNRLTRIMSLNFTLSTLFIFTAYIFTNFPIEFHLATSMDRLVFQFAGFNIIIIISLLNNLINKKII